MILGIYGTGGSGRELHEMIEVYDELKNQWSEIVYIDDTKESCAFRSCKMMPLDEFVAKYSPKHAKIAVAVGEPTYRELLADKVEKIGYELATIISPSSEVSAYAKIGKGVVIKSNVIVSSDAKISDNVWIQSNSIIGHDVQIGENCQISAMVVVAGRTVVEKNVYIGVSACIREDLHVGHDSIISMGAIVLKSVRAEKIVMGNPGREIAENTNHKVFK